MKNIFIRISVIALIAGTSLSSCVSSKKKLDNAENRVAEAKKDLDRANEEYRADMANYRKETSEKIAANEKSILDLNEKIANENEDTKLKYQEQIADLKSRNNEMKKKMVDYKDDGKQSWDKFKTEFSHDMEELGKAFKGIVVKNTN